MTSDIKSSSELLNMYHYKNQIKKNQKYYQISPNHSQNSIKYHLLA